MKTIDEYFQNFKESQETFKNAMIFETAKIPLTAKTFGRLDLSRSHLSLLYRNFEFEFPRRTFPNCKCFWDHEDLTNFEEVTTSTYPL